MASSADVAFESVHIELLPKRTTHTELPKTKPARSSPKISPLNTGSEHSKAHSKWAIVRERGIPLALGRDPGDQSTISRTARKKPPMMVTIEHEKAKTLCGSKNVIVYVLDSDTFHGFDTWELALAFITKEKPQKWWLDSKQPPDFDTCQRGKISLISVTGVKSDLCRLLCPWNLEFSWERADGKSSDGDLVRLFEKLPRDQFAISASRLSENLLFSLNMPMCGTKTAVSFFPKHPMVPHLNQQHALFNPTGESETAYCAACDSRMTDRNFDMPYIMLRGKNFFVTYGWSLNNVCQSLRGSFVNTRAFQHMNGLPIKDLALDELFARGFELCCSEIEHLVDESTAGADACDEKREQFATSESLTKQKDFDSNEYLRQVYDEIVKCNRLIRTLLPKKTVFQTVQNSTQGESTWPSYIGKSCAQRLEAAVSVFSYIEARAYSNHEQLKSLQDSCLSMINLSMTKQGTVMNVIMQRFAVVTMIFAPLTLLTGFFGMNVPIPGPSMNLDEHDGSYAYFWGIVGSMAVCTIFMWFVFKALKLWS